MMAFRRLVLCIHLAAGSMAGVVIPVMFGHRFPAGLRTSDQRLGLMAGTTGCADIQAIASWKTCCPKFFELQQATPATLLVLSDPAAPVEATFGRERGVLLNPYTGDVLAETSARSRAFFQTVENWHRMLGAQGDNRAIGRAFTGACNLAFLLPGGHGPLSLVAADVGDGRALDPQCSFKSGLKGRARDWNWHNAIGIWSALPLLIIVTTGVIMSYPPGRMRCCIT